MAGIFERMAMITKSNINDLLDKFEDPEKVINQTIIDAKEEYARAKKESAAVLATERINKDKMDNAEREAEKWHAVAANALKAANEEDARKALEKENEYRQKAEGFSTAYKASQNAADKVRKNLKMIEKEIHEMEDKASQIKMKAATAKTINTANKVSAKGIKKGAFEAFDRMDQKADRQLAEAESMESLNAGEESGDEDALLEKYAGGVSTDDALARLKAELGM